MIAAGLLSGIAIALMSIRLLAAVLYGITPLDASTFGFVAGILVAAAAAAAYEPARRATAISAATALRAD